MKVSDYVASFIANLGIKHVFGVVGGGSMYLNDSFGNHPQLKFIPNHHEQASAMAAEAYARLNGIGCCLVTTGPGGTNAITGVACAWVDSIPMIVISGQVTINTMIGDSGVRQYGVQESNIVKMVKSITKYAVCIANENNVRYELEKAAYLAKDGRGGPVWLDIPLDVQSKEIDSEKLMPFNPIEYSAYARAAKEMVFSGQISQCMKLLQESKRPVLIVGNGVRLSGAEKEILYLAFLLQIPIITSWSAKDNFGEEHSLFIGSCGLFGNRAANFAAQNADLLLVIGCRLSIPMIGHNTKAFAPNAKIIMVDIDQSEMNKPSLHIDLKICQDAKAFVQHFMPFVADHMFGRSKWLKMCREWKEKYPVVAEHEEETGFINSFHFVDELSKKLPDDAVVVTDMGTSFTCIFQAAKMKQGQRWLTASGHAPMGYGLPGAIGAHFATGKRVICIVGDGALQMNVQELATISHFNLPITIFVLNNGGYLTMKHTQDNHFKRRVGADKNSGVFFPNTLELAASYGISSSHHFGKSDWLAEIMTKEKRPYICQIAMNPDQPLIPRVQTKRLPDGSIVGGDLADMFPYLPRDEFEENMRVSK